jgi:TPR repeat protein
MLGVRAFQKARYEEAFQRLAPFAEAGELRAQLILARLYYAGNGVERSQERYLHWLQAAADNGDKAAKAQLKRWHRDQADPAPPEGAHDH